MLLGLAQKYTAAWPPWHMSGRKKRRMGGSSSSPSPPPRHALHALALRKRSGREFISATMAAPKLLYHTCARPPPPALSVRPSARVRQIRYNALSFSPLFMPLSPPLMLYIGIGRLAARPPACPPPRRPLLALAAGPGQYFRRRRSNMNAAAGWWGAAAPPGPWVHIWIAAAPKTLMMGTWSAVS